MGMNLLAVAGLLLLLGAVASLVAPRNSTRMGFALASQVAATALVLSAALPVIAWGTAIEATYRWSYPIDALRTRLDPLGAFFLAWSLPMTLLGAVYAVGYLAPYLQKGRNAGAHFALLNMVSLSFIIVYTAENALIFLFGWEIAAVAAWLLVIWDYRNQKVRFAGFNYLVSTHVGMFVLVAAFMILHSQTASMDFSAFAPFLSRPGTLRNVVFVLLVTAFGFKSAFFPFHTWLPRAHAAAPAHVSALMSGVIHKAGLFALLRFTLMLGTPEPWMGWLLLAFSGLSTLLGVLYTATQRDLKRLLGYSSTENVGIAGLGFGVGYLGLAWHRPGLALVGFTGGALHVLNHAFFKCLLFYAAGAVYRATHTVDLERLGGLARKMPRTAVAFLVGAVAISALPPLNGFVSEFLIYSGLLSAEAPSGEERILLVATAALLSFVGATSALSMVRAFGLAFLGTPRAPEVHPSGDAPPSMAWPMGLHLAGTVVLGLFPAAGLWLVSPVARLLVDAPAARGPEALLAPLRTGNALLLGAVALLLLATLGARRAARRHVTWGCGYSAPTPRMQYTGTSFSSQFVQVFEAFVLELRREKLPEGPFPEAESHVHTHHADAVERRMFESLGNGEDLVRGVAHRIPEEPRFAFAAGLISLVVILALLASHAGGAP